MDTADMAAALDDTDQERLSALADYHGVSLPVAATAILAWYAQNRLGWHAPEELDDITPAIRWAQTRLAQEPAAV